MRRTSILTFGCLLALSIVIGQLLTRTTAGQVEAPCVANTGSIPDDRDYRRRDRRRHDLRALLD